MLDGLSQNEMMKHIIDCFVSLIRIEKTRKENNKKFNIQEKKDNEINLMNANYKVFVIAVTMIAQ